MEEEIRRYYVPKSSEGTDKVNLVLIASGSGSDFKSIADAFKEGRLPDVNPPQLISTKRNVGCLTKAEDLGLRGFTFDRRDFFSQDHYNLEIKKALQGNFADLVFLVGCIQMIYPIAGIDIYNIHPADPEKHGGDHEHGLEVHFHVLDEISDLIYRGRKKLEDRFYSYPTIHEVDEKYDSGKILLQQTVEIPNEIVRDFVNGRHDEYVIAKKLQDVVLPYEHLMLPPAVKMAARRILERRKG